MKNIFKILILLASVNLSFALPKLYHQEGTVTYYYGDKETFKGEIVNGVKKGPAYETYEDGTVVKYNYVDGIKQGKGIIEYPNGIIETITIEDGMIYGKAVKKGKDLTENYNYKFGRVDGKLEGKKYSVKYFKNYYYDSLIDEKYITENGETVFKYNEYAIKMLETNKYGKLEVINLGLNDEDVLESYIFTDKESNKYIGNFISSKGINILICINKDGKKTYLKKFPDKIKDIFGEFSEYEGKDKLITKEIKGDGYLVKIKDGLVEYAEINNSKVKVYFKDAKQYKSIIEDENRKVVELYNDGILDGKSEVIYPDGKTFYMYFENGRLKANSEIIYTKDGKITDKYTVNKHGLCEINYKAYLKEEDEKLIGYIPMYSIREFYVTNPIYVYAHKKTGEYIIYEKLNSYDLMGDYIQVDKVK